MSYYFSIEVLPGQSLREKNTVKTLINARAFIRIFSFHREGVGIYKRLQCSQSIFEKPKHSVCFITSVPCLAIL